MVGTANYSWDTSKSINAKDPLEERRFTNELEESSKNIARYTTGLPAVGLNRFQKQAVSGEHLQGEAGRRTQAAEGALALAGRQDLRVAGAANQLAAASDKAQNTASDLSQRQAQALKEAEYEKLKGLRDVYDKKRDIDWTLEKNQTNRDDKLENAWVDGILDQKLQEIQVSGKMKLQDIDQYYKLKVNDIEQGFQDWKNMTDIERTKFLAEMTASAQAFAQLMEGAVTIAQATASALSSKK
jgi:hypothetical protein